MILEQGHLAEVICKGQSGPQSSELQIKPQIFQLTSMPDYVLCSTCVSL